MEAAARSAQQDRQQDGAAMMEQLTALQWRSPCCSRCWSRWPSWPKPLSASCPSPLRRHRGRPLHRPASVRLRRPLRVVAHHARLPALQPRGSHVSERELQLQRGVHRPRTRCHQHGDDARRERDRRQQLVRLSYSAPVYSVILTEHFSGSTTVTCSAPEEQWGAFDFSFFSDATAIDDSLSAGGLIAINCIPITL